MPPSFMAPKRYLYEVEYGTSLNITCHASGMPRPRVRWRTGVFVFKHVLSKLNE